MINKIDHFAVGANDLTQGMKFVQETLGISMSLGGKHDTMSTHNCVMQAGNETFLELIAIDPDAPTPDRTRWFTLDDKRTQEKISARPRALCWVVNTDDLDAVVAASPVDLGEIVHFQRGDRTWRLTVPSDGHLPGNALLPAFIEWSPGPHPSKAQQELGATLKKIQISHPEPSELQATMAALNINHLVTITQGAEALSFEIDSPKGTVIID
jgi:hypothetical protein